MLVDSCKDNNTQGLRFEIWTPHFYIYKMCGPYLLGNRGKKKLGEIKKAGWQYIFVRLIECT